MTIFANGNVGINTGGNDALSDHRFTVNDGYIAQLSTGDANSTASGNKFNVLGNFPFHVDPSTGVNTTGLRTSWDDYGINFGLMETDGIDVRDGLISWEDATGDELSKLRFKFRNASTVPANGGLEVMTMTPDGNVGIGTESPGARLHVVGETGKVTVLAENVDDPEIYGYNYLSRSVGEFTKAFAAETTGGGAASENFVVMANGKSGFGGIYDSYYYIRSYGDNKGNSWQIVSDSRYKKEIADISDPLSLIRDIRGTSYLFKQDEFPGQHFTARRQYGFIAQELLKTVPEAVTQGEDGYYAVNYDMIIPILVEGLKELDTETAEENQQLKEMIADQQNQIEELKGVLANVCTEPCVNSSKSQGGASLDETPTLGQNTPNPFNQETAIPFYVPQEVSTATIYVYDLNGKQLKGFIITERGHNQLRIQANEFAAGMYLYALVADGKQIDMKRMILTD